MRFFVSFFYPNFAASTIQAYGDFAVMASVGAVMASDGAVMALRRAKMADYKH